MNARKASTRLLSFLLAFCMVFGMLPVTALTANAASDTDYLFLATDRHTNTSIIGNIINNMESVIGENELDYLGLGGDMVGSGNNHPGYSSSEVLAEVTGATTSLSAANVDIVAGIHDMNVNDDVGIVLPYQGGGAQIYEGDNFYVYGVEEYCISDDSSESIWSAQAQAFVNWANGDGIDTSKVIVVLSHYPLHVKRNDNDGAYYWHQALNTVATGGDATVERDVFFFHGHNHTVDGNEYVYNVGDTMSIQNGSGTASDTIYYTYATAGYLNQNSKATLMAITDTTVTLTKYSTSGSGTAMTTVTRVVTESHEHSYVSEVTTAATCTETGVKTYTCECGHSYTEEIAATGHSYTDGTCGVCGAADPDYVAPETTAPATEPHTHNYTASVTKEATCTEAGVKTYTCECGDSYTEEIAATGHSYTDGTCTVCGAADPDYVAPTEEPTTETTEESTDGSETAKTVDFMTISEGSGVAYVVGDKQILYKMYVSYTDGTFGYATQNDCALTIYNESSAVVTEEEALSTVGTYSADVTYMDYTCGTRLTFTVSASGDSAYDLLNLVINGATLTADVTNVTEDETVGTAMSAVEASAYVAYEISATIEEGSTATVSIPVPSDWTYETCTVYYLNENNEAVEHAANVAVTDGVVTFTTDHFSTWVVAGDTTDDGDGSASASGTTTTPKTVYVLSSGNPSGKVLIASSATAGSVNLVANVDGDLDNVATTVLYGDCDGDGDSEYYIDLTDTDATNALWTVAGRYTFENQNEYLYRNNSNLSTNSNYTTWSYSDNHLYSSGKQNTYYLRYNSGWTVNNSSSNATSIYFYVPTEVDVTTETTVKYTLEASDVKYFTDDTDKQETVSAVVKANGTETTTLTGTYSYNILSDTNIIIDVDVTNAAADNTIVFTGNTGTAEVRVYYTFTKDNVEYTIWDDITVTASAPTYGIEITAPASDTVKTGSTVDLEAVAYKNDAVNSAANVTWISSDEDIATVDAKGVVTGKKAGTVVLTAKYTYGDGENDYVTDTVTLNVADAVYTVDIENEKGESVTKTIVKKSVTSETTHVLTAAVTKDGEEVTLTTSNVKFVTATERAAEDFTFEADTLYWTVSDDAIVSGITFAENAETGLLEATVAFTGTKFGAVNISTIYNGKYDTVTLTTSPNEYYTTVDGGDDFPQYPNPGSININKTATAVGNFSQTGIAQIELYGNGIPVDGSGPIDVVIMLDMTGSMSDTAMTAAEESAIAFAKQIVMNDDGTYNDNRIAVLAFNSSSSSPFTYWSLGTITADQWDSFCTAVRGASDDQVSGGTPYDEALEECQSILSAAKTDGTGNNRSQFCVFVSDGGPTSYKYITNYDAVKAGTASAYTTQSASASGGSNQSDSNFATIATYTHEYYSTLMKDAGVTMYSVLTGLSASSYPNCATILENIATDSDKAYVVENGSDTSALTSAFTNIASEIKQAASNVTVYDTITPEYELIFELPDVLSDNNTGLTDDSFYIEVVNYKLDANYNRTGYYDVLGRIYLTQDDAGNVSVSKYVAYTNVSDDTIASTTATTLSTTPVYTAVESGKAGYFNKNDDGTYTFVSGGKGSYNLTSGAVVYESNDDGDLVIATQYFIYDEATKSFTWTTDKLGKENQIALRYFVYLTGSVEGLESADPSDDVESKAYPTNTSAWIAYTNHLDHLCYQYFPVPQLTWNGAQVTYVFYLVDKDGFPVNQAGTRINFSNAVEVTDRFTESLVWNNAEGKKSLDVTTIAEEVLPEYYTLYDPEAVYEIHVYENETGAAMGTNYFKISGSKAINGDDDGVTTDTDWTTKVYMDKSSTKYDAPGYYTAKGLDVTDVNDKSVNASTAVATGFDFADTTVAFAVLWTPELQSDTVVVDYGLDVVIDVTKNDFFNNSINGISATAPKNVTINTAVGDTAFGKANITTDNYTVSIEDANNVRFHQNSMEFKEPVTFYYDSAVKALLNGSTKDGYMYSSVTVIPATTVYYEDSFLTLNANGTTWTQEGTTVTDTQDADRPGPSKISADLDADNAYGYDSAYKSMSQYSMGSARKVHVGENSYATAEFTFFGTGFDVIGLTSNQTGTLLVQVYADDAETATKSYFVDTYYGYTLADDFNKYVYTYWGVDDEGNQKWSVETEVVTTRGVDTEPPEELVIGESTYTVYEPRWVTTTNDPNALFQVPVMKVSGLTYGKYKAVITATYNSFFDHTSEDGYDLYLDAIRIYDPTGNNSDVANEAYKDDGEGWPIYKELRNLVISAEALEANGTLDGVAFIDGVGNTSSVENYTSYGPNNELYLASSQSIAFRIADVFVATDGVTTLKPVDVQLGIKTVYGESTVTVFNAAEDTVTEGTTVTTTAVRDNELSIALNTATDMYYSIAEQKDGVIVIANEGENIISITNLKFTFEEAAKLVEVETDDGQTVEAPLVVSALDAQAAIRALTFYEVTTNVADTIVEKGEEKPEAKDEPKVEETKPEVKETEPKVEETKPEVKETEPKVEETKPEVKETEPKVDETKPEVKETEPKVEETKPEVKETEPKVEETKPEVKETEPKVEETKPEVKETEPKVEETKPEVKETEPKVEETKPEVKETEPKVEETKPEVKETEPKVEETKPEVKETEPKVEETKPEVKETEPKVEETKPEVKEEPKVQETKPEVKETEPKVQETKPEVKETEPKVEETKPEVKETEPKVEETKPEEKDEPKAEESVTDVENASVNQDGAFTSMMNNIRNAITSVFRTLFGWLIG